jgi:DUF438 domain-containing protein
VEQEKKHNMKKTSDMEKVRKPADILEHVRNGENPTKIRQESRQLLSTLKLSDIRNVQKYLLNRGISLDQIRTHVYAFASILDDQLALLRTNLSACHPVRRIPAEHEMFECFPADIAEVNLELQEAGVLTELNSELRKPDHITGHLQTIDAHNQQENDRNYDIKNIKNKEEKKWQLL